MEGLTNTSFLFLLVSRLSPSLCAREQFAANDPDVLLQAAKLVEKHCDAVDINLCVLSFLIPGPSEINQKLIEQGYSIAMVVMVNTVAVLRVSQREGIMGVSCRMIGIRSTR
jgi:hypothetical protein